MKYKHDNKKTSMRNKFDFIKNVFFIWCLFLPLSALAAENGNPAYLPGAASYFAATLPPHPGLYLFNQINYFDKDSMYGNDGSKNHISLRVKGVINTFRFIGVWPTTPFGTENIASQLIIPVGGFSTHMFSGAARTSGHDQGIGDIIINPVFARWKVTDNFHLTAGLDFVAPTGRYNENDIANMGNNYWSIQPVFGLRYEDPEGIDIAINPRFTLNSQNRSTHYTSGDGINIDFVLGWHIGNFEPAIVGGFWYQYDADEWSRGDVGEGGNKARKLTAGPAISYRKGPLYFILQYQHDYLVRNAAGGDTFWLNITIPLTTASR